MGKAMVTVLSHESVPQELPMSQATQVNKLTPIELEQALAALPGWRLQGDAITRTFTLPGFPDALVLAVAAGQLAQRANHHPDILIQYSKVTFTLSTHSAGGLTRLDFALAQQIDGIAR
jgi:4a-hydroxytetrahydrobiopterin dehydratase